MFRDHKVTVIIPALDEESSLPRVIRDIPQDVIDDVIVVDNGSRDGTAEAARESGARVVIEDERGYGAACLRGLSEIEETDIVVILDADYSDYPEQVTRLLIPIADGAADFVIGSRVLGEREAGALAPQAFWGNKLTTFLIWLLCGHSFTDMGPFRAMRFEPLKKLNMRDKDYGWNVEMQVKALRAGLRIREVPVDYRRRVGKSKISGTLGGTVRAGVKIIYSVFKYALTSAGAEKRRITNNQ